MSVLIRGMEMPNVGVEWVCFVKITNGAVEFTGETESVIYEAVELPPHGRLIDADAFRKEMDKHYPFDKLTQSKHGEADAAKGTILLMLAEAPTIIPAEEAVNAITAVPAADVRPVVRGHWIFDRGDLATCSNCGSETLKRDVRNHRFCHYCGADMRKEDGHDRNL